MLYVHDLGLIFNEQVLGLGLTSVTLTWPWPRRRRRRRSWLHHC